MAGNDRRRGASDKTRGAAGVSAEDAELFRRAFHDVVPLRGRRRPAPPPPAAPTLGHSRAPGGQPPFKARPHQPPQPKPIQKPALPPLRTGVAIGLDRRSAERLRRGRMAVAARLDLHGHSQDEAHDALIGFVTSCAAAGHRCVLIVTGKGTFSRGGGVLRQRVPEWLNQPPCRAHIVAMAAARPRHGGAGALYVLLRRHRGSLGGSLGGPAGGPVQ